jgi:hypothetical protein
MTRGPFDLALKYLAPAELAERWGGHISVQTHAQWRANGKGPAYTKLGGRVLYSTADIGAYEARQRRP